MTPVKLLTNGAEVIRMQDEDRTNLTEITTVEMDAEILPLTRVPLLDTVDQYVVPRSLEESFESTSPIDITCQFQRTDVVEGIFGGYAHFISAFTGLDELAFAFALGGNHSVLPDSHGCVRAHVGPAVSQQHSRLQNVHLTNFNGHAHEFDKEKIQFGIQVEIDHQVFSRLQLDKVCF